MEGPLILCSRCHTKPATIEVETVAATHQTLLCGDCEHIFLNERTKTIWRLARRLDGTMTTPTSDQGFSGQESCEHQD